MWLEHRWQVAAFSEELGNAGAGSLLPRKIGGRPILMYRTEAGQPVALTDACAHRKLPLSLGKRVGDSIQCAYHGMTYRPDGSCVAIPGQTSIPAGARVAPYPIVERDGLVWVWTAEPALADPASIPDLPWLHDGKWTVVRGYHYIEAGPLLVVDNLLDLSHETFVHAETIGNAAVADSPVTAEIIDGKRVRVHRYMSRITPLRSMPNSAVSRCSSIVGTRPSTIPRASSSLKAGRSRATMR